MPKPRAKNRPKRPDSAALARPRKVHIQHGGGSTALMLAPLDGRTRLGKAYRAHVEALERHVGGNPTPPQARLVDQAARLALLAELSWAELARTGPFVDGVAVPAVDTFLRAAGQERGVLQVLGIEPRSVDVPDLQKYLAARDDDGEPST